ncbi:hypothetical protein NKH72_21825 [Mesorhizobium sp. M0955]|uniref:hypothetical protein n=1 Tax=Mesorhizobium sp. M0955 TaxID=2957033 RepID=UPI0033366D63
MSKHVTIPLSTILATPGVPLSVDFWNVVADRVRRKRQKLNAITAGNAITELRLEAHKALEKAEKDRLVAVAIFNNCRAVERDMAVLLNISLPALKAKTTRNRAK